jgi:hypothetical protein
MQSHDQVHVLAVHYCVLKRQGEQGCRCIPNLMAIQSCSEKMPLWIQEVINSYMTDQHAQDLLAQLGVTSPTEQGYSLHQGIIRQGS